jgi:hypothetical protein
MPSTYSPNLALELIGTGDQAGTWGNTTNTNLGTLIEQAISGYEVQTLTAGTTLTLTIPNGSTGVARNMYLEFNGTGSTVIVPSNKKLYFVSNNCTSGTITFKVAGQTGVTIPKGAKQILVSDGTDIEEAVSPGVEGVTTTALTAYGVDAGDSVTTGTLNTFIGYNSGTAVTSGAGNTHVGYESGSGYNASFNTYIGNLSGSNLQNGGNTGLGNSAIQGSGVSATGTNNTGIGFWAMRDITTGSNNTALGYTAGFTSVTTQSNTTSIGYQAEVTGSNQVQLGNSSTTVYAYGAVQDRSDARDKTDIRDTHLGLNFIMALRPRDFKWDMREDYRPPFPGPEATQAEIDAYINACQLSNLTHNGTHTRKRYHQGLIAQEVKQTMDELGVDFGGYQDHKINGGDDLLTIGYEELVAPLIKAIQELKAEFDEYKSTHP